MTKSLYIGVISGTSVDGIDVSLISIVNGKTEFIGAKTFALDSRLRNRMLLLGQTETILLDELGELDAELGLVIGKCVNKFLKSLAINTDEIVAVGSHGQTVRHRPDTLYPFSLQIGDPNQIAESTGITCVADFRRRDIAAGGQGAPLVPLFHDAIFRSNQEDRVVLNIGGISNITALSANPETPPIGFDTGPGNALMDSWIQKHLDLPFDKNGKWASEGSTSPALLAQLMEDPYLKQSPPKSTGREHYNLDWLAQFPTMDKMNPQDVQSTLLDFTATTIISSIQSWAPTIDRLIVCGGGRLNSTLMGKINELANYSVIPVEQCGVNGDSLEASAFAWLAHKTLEGQPGSHGSVTGAKGPRVLGAIYHGSISGPTR